MSDLFGTVCPCCGQPAPEQRATPFNEFWAVWPDKRGKAPAHKAFNKLTAAEQQVATRRAKHWAIEWRKRNPEASHIMAGSYLTQRRFLDEGQAPKLSKGSMDEVQAEQIKSGKRYLCTNISSLRGRELVNKGLVTTQECVEVGVL